ncbi:tetratricopeptide repeat protein [Spongiimicrobium salis]|uniref:tetratricopeptide repeat protein n=1 Tax=Spongiimicrobium salis TaxID=1667022 RepID=UPI00374D67AD
MKTKILILAAMSYTLVGFSQKSEIKAAEKALKKGDVASAKTALEGAASLIDAADPKIKSQYAFLKGRIYADLAKKGDDAAFETAIASFNEVVSIEESGKKKYTEQAQAGLQGLSTDLINSAVADTNAEKFEQAASKLYMGYNLSKRDTIYLYYAASSAVNAKNYEDALKYYNELKDLGYDGREVKYTAVNLETNEVEEMSKQQRDLLVKSGTYNDPKEVKTASKKAEIVKNIALIYTQTGNDEKALEAYKDARADNPDDVNLVLNEANLHYKLGDKDTFKSMMEQASAMAPDNADLQYNIGVINMEQGNLEEARAAYNKALEINPGYINAQLNLSSTYINEGNALIDQLNELGTSRADLKKYDELKQKKDDLFVVGANVLEEALKQNPDNQGILSQLKNIYGALGDNENFLRIKKLLGE